MTSSQQVFTAKESKNTLQTRLMSNVHPLHSAHEYKVLPGLVLGIVWYKKVIKIC